MIVARRSVAKLGADTGEMKEMSYRITVEGEGMRFSAAHFALLPKGAEPLHGHSYEVVVELDGPLSDVSWVADFGLVRSIAASLCREIDHRFLLPLASPALKIRQAGGAYEITVGERRYVIPEQDVAGLPIDNSTAERLAQWLAGRLSKELEVAGVKGLRRLSVGVKEGPGQAAWYWQEPGGQEAGGQNDGAALP
jgi:6-pyruvoyltetrahydropterin/6-carboxytetrahydropterin synthase